MSDKCKHGESWIACQVCSDLCDHGAFWRDCSQCSPARIGNLVQRTDELRKESNDGLKMNAVLRADGEVVPADNLLMAARKPEDYIGKVSMGMRIANLQAENAALRGAIKSAGFSVMETSGDWSIHDVSEHGKAEARRALEVANESVDVSIDNANLRKALQFVKDFFNKLETGSSPGDPLTAMREKFHAPVHARIDAALSPQQKTKCAVCGVHRHTPLRVDRMGGYVCLECIDVEIDRQEALNTRLANALLCIEDISMNCMPAEDGSKQSEGDKAVGAIYLVAHGARGCCKNCPSAKRGVEIAESFRENEEKDAEERKKRNAIEFMKWDGKIEHSEL